MLPTSPDRQDHERDAALGHAYRSYQRARTPQDRDRAFRIIERAVLPSIGSELVRLTGPSVAIEDLRQAARLGLLRGLDTWRKDGGRSLRRHLIFEMVMCVRKQNERFFGLIHVPAHLVKSRRAVDRTRECLWNVLGRQPTDNEILEEVADNNMRASWSLALRHPNTDVTDVGIDPGDGGFEADLLSRLTVEHWLSTLNPNQRAALIWRYIHEIEDYDELRALTGWGYKRVGNTLYQARNHLRRLLANEVDESGRARGPRGVRI